MSEEPMTLTEKLDLASFIGGLVADLKALRAGQISNRDAHARAELARQVLRGVHYIVTAQKFIEQRALPVESARPSRKRTGTTVV